jgi:hypothetical protein
MASCSPARITTASITRCFRRLLSLLVPLLLLGASLARADNLEVRDARIENADDGYVVTADFGIELNPRLEEAINKGVTLHFVFEFELLRPRWYWFDEKPVEAVQAYRLSYHALTRQYRLSAGTLYQGFPTLGDALKLLARPRLPAFDRARVKQGETYNAAVRMRLDVAQLPKPFQLSALTNREWTLDSDWKRFSFRPESNGAGERK